MFGFPLEIALIIFPPLVIVVTLAPRAYVVDSSRIQVLSKIAAGCLRYSIWYGSFPIVCNLDACLDMAALLSRLLADHPYKI